MFLRMCLQTWLVWVWGRKELTAAAQGCSRWAGVGSGCAAPDSGSGGCVPRSLSPRSLRVCWGLPALPGGQGLVCSLWAGMLMDLRG